MDRVLLDGSAVALSARLLRGDDLPSAVHVFDLANLVEGLILHDTVLVLSTTPAPHRDLVDSVRRFGSALQVKTRTLEHLRTAHTGPEPKLPTGHDVEFDSYLRALEAVFRSPRWARRPARSPSRSAIGRASAESTPHADDLFGSNAPPMSSAGFESRIRERITVYLMAAEVLDAPYRADSLRWPLVYRAFAAGSPRDLQMDEVLLRLAEEFEHRRIAGLNDVLGRPAFVAPLPLLLRRVLQESRSVDDIPRVTGQIRDSDAARRFRDCARDLTAEVAAGELGEVLRGMRHFGRTLEREFGQAETEVYWTLLTQGVTAATAGVTPPLAVQGARSLATVGAAGKRWGAGRRFALIAKSLNAGRKALDLNHELERLFGARITTEDVEVLDRLHRVDHRSS